MRKVSSRTLIVGLILFMSSDWTCVDRVVSPVDAFGIQGTSVSRDLPMLNREEDIFSVDIYIEGSPDAEC